MIFSDLRQRRHREPEWMDAPDVDAAILADSLRFIRRVNALLRYTRAYVNCHVRAPTPELGLERIKRNLQQSLVWDESFSDRIIAVPGDLSKPLLGLPKEAFAELTSPSGTGQRSADGDTSGAPTPGAVSPDPETPPFSAEASI